MRPVDLTSQPPRSCRVEMDGIGYLTRAIDKVRAQMPGGDIGSYVVLYGENPTMSGFFYHTLGITHEEFVDAVAWAANDAEVARWLRTRVADERLARWNVILYGIRVADIPLPRRDRVRAASWRRPPSRR